MPEISKINALAMGCVAKVDGLAKASILDIDGVAASFTPPLDTYTGATAAYSVRLLRTAYTGDIMRVRRASDSVEADVGFDGSNELSLTSPISNTSDALSYTDFADFVDHTGTPTDAFVRYWYDQASTNDAGQSTEGLQPQIYDATTGLITENCRPTLEFSNDQITTPFDTSSTDFDLPQTMVLVTRNVTGGSFQGYNFIVCGGGSQAFGKFEMQTRAGFGTFTVLRTGTGSGSVANVSVSDSTTTAIYLHTGIWGSSNMKMAYNGGSIVTGAATNANDHATTVLALGSQSALTGTFRTSEWIIWPVDQDSEGNKSGIETNINGYFSIY